MQSPSLRDLNLSSEELKEIAQFFAQKRGIKDYESMPEDRLLNALISSKPIKRDKKSNFSKERTGKIKKEFKNSKHKFPKSKRNEIRRNLYEIKNKKNIFTLGIEKTEKNLDELDIFLSKIKRYYHHDDAEYKGIKEIEGLFDLSIGEDYYKPIIVNGAFNKYDSIFS